jgi:hypothetical protein
MRNAEPHGESPRIPSREMSRENSRDGAPSAFAHPVCNVEVLEDRADTQRAAPPPPKKTSGGSRILVRLIIASKLTSRLIEHHLHRPDGCQQNSPNPLGSPRVPQASLGSSIDQLPNGHRLHTHQCISPLIGQTLPERLEARAPLPKRCPWVNPRQIRAHRRRANKQRVSKPPDSLQGARASKLHLPRDGEINRRRMKRSSGSCKLFARRVIQMWCTAICKRLVKGEPAIS